MTAGRQAVVWLAVLAAFLVAVTALSDIMLPFVAGMLVAYFLDPVVDRVEAWGPSRTLATSLVTGSFFVLVAVLLILLLPLLQDQVIKFADGLPKYARTLAGMVEPVKAALAPLIERVQSHLPPEEVARLRSAAGDYLAQGVQWTVALGRELFSRGAAILGLISLLVITPVVAFYLLRDWDRIVASIDGWLPRAHAETVREQIRHIDRTLSGFVRGQATVCLLLGAFYGIGLTVVGLDFGLILGLATGIVSFVPIFGMLLGVATGVAMALVQFALDPVRVGLVLAVFAIGQVIEGQFLTPRIVGRKIGLHPVWVVFALLAGGALYGFVGLLLAVPAAAVIGVLVRFALSRYLSSPLYLGAEGAVAEAAAADAAPPAEANQPEPEPEPPPEDPAGDAT
jgi:predicted PurR-regulated permease PerM